MGRRGRVVLVVEDRDDLYEAYSDALAEAGYCVEGADDRQALLSARRLKPDLVLLGHGDRVARDLRNDPEMRDVLIAVLDAPCSPAQMVHTVEDQLRPMRNA